MKHKHISLLLLTLATVLAFVLRFWQQSAALDSQGLYISGHPATLVLLGASGLFVLLFLILSRLSPGRGRDHQVLTYGPISTAMAFVGGLSILLGVVLDGFSNEQDIWGLLLLVLGILAAISMVVLALLRQKGNQIPLWELLPIFYLLLRLVFLFKSWSTDPMILDYCFKLLALVTGLLGGYGAAGFCFDLGQPRKTLFYSSCGVFFSAMAVADSLQEGSINALFSDLGLMLWLLPVVFCLLQPHAPPTSSSHPESSATVS